MYLFGTVNKIGGNGGHALDLSTHTITVVHTSFSPSLSF